ncbi:hypothetical protein TOPH_04106 [Tolypocladium ophioglossoides CBS 100239]|uniref:DUF7136 domain-containing protein n=1 Tax=Tolypocladium ophioglossoides (strain CBS 100239) TaxID=1163406 RepID=A0A0L0NBQ5_TOLOC|nr:hypothetical protein TOPH_04106 [Tolypocladium ophioglossoides CBS 100239]
MDVFSRRLYCLGWWYLLLACSRAVDATNLTFPQTVEVDLVFPRNDDTYAPVPLMPVFAIQNLHVSQPLFLDFHYYIIGPPYKYNGLIQPKHGWANYSSGPDPYLVFHYTSQLNNTEGRWMLSWELRSGNCSMSDEYAPLKVAGLVQRNYIYFTTKNGAQQPDLVAATQDGTCSKTESFAFNITGMLDVPLGSHYNNQASCPTLSPAAPTPDPCRVKVDSASASSISYAIQSSACWGGLMPAFTCPPGYDKSAARRAVQSAVGGAAWLAGTAWLAVTLGWLANMA